VAPGLFVATIFSSSFLVFLVQPLLSKYILPWHGGTPAVWTTCLLFFQVALFAGYSYAHLIIRTLGGYRPFYLHGLLLIAALFLLPIVPADRWQPQGNENPVWLIVRMLAATVGPAYLLLAGTGPLLQAWYVRTNPGRSPFALFAMSNTGSLLALLSYPFVIERFWSGRQQAWGWSGGFVILVILVSIGCWLTWRAQLRPEPAVIADYAAAGSPAVAIRGLWILWSALGVVLFMAVTLQLTENIATLPFLWIVPLSLYLFSFVITFAGARWYPRGPMAAGILAALVVLYLVVPGFFAGFGKHVSFSPIWQIALFSGALLVLTVVCHGELYRSRPASSHLTEFYLAIAGGGMLGGVFVGIAAPAWLPPAGELYLGSMGTAALVVAVRWREAGAGQRRGRKLGWSLGAVILLVFFGVLFGKQARSLTAGSLWSERNFFGTVSVHLLDGESSTHRRLIMKHGSTKHGAQYLKSSYRALPATYFSPFTGVGLTITAYGETYGQQAPMKVGVIGLGIGTLAAYGRRGDQYRLYEINPAVVDLARRQFSPDEADLHFSYLADCEAETHVVLGDGRLQLARELAAEPAGESFDILVLDAFTSGSIPVHLLTSEAMELYEQHLKPHGLMAMHISNKYIDLAPVVQRLAARHGFDTVQLINKRRDFPEEPEVDSDISNRAVWMILYRDTICMERLALKCKALVGTGELTVVTGNRLHVPPGRVWTDNYSNLFDAIR